MPGLSTDEKNLLRDRYLKGLCSSAQKFSVSLLDVGTYALSSMTLLYLFVCYCLFDYLLTVYSPTEKNFRVLDMSQQYVLAGWKANCILDCIKEGWPAGRQRGLSLCALPMWGLIWTTTSSPGAPNTRKM